VNGLSPHKNLVQAVSSQFLITPTTNESGLAFDQQAHAISRRCPVFSFAWMPKCASAALANPRHSLSLAMLKASAGNTHPLRGLFGERSGELVFSGGHLVQCVTISLAQKVNSPRLC